MPWDSAYICNRPRLSDRSRGTLGDALSVPSPPLIPDRLGLATLFLLQPKCIIHPCISPFRRPPEALLVTGPWEKNLWGQPPSPLGSARQHSRGASDPWHVGNPKLHIGIVTLLPTLPSHLVFVPMPMLLPGCPCWLSCPVLGSILSDRRLECF
jgi:hypothetical protein